MKKACLLFLLAVIQFTVYAQRDTANVLHTQFSPPLDASIPPDKFRINTTLAHFRIHDGTYSYRSGNSGGASNPGFFDKTSWNSSPYKAGYLDSASNFRMNYRYLEPQGWDPSYSPGYPMVVMLEGAVERANCYSGPSGPTTCYYGTKHYQPHFPIGSNGFPATITQANRNNLFNNDHQLLNGGQAHLNARNRANGKLPNDPTLDPRAFPGFVLFPQMLNGWDGFNGTTPGWKSDINDMIRIVRLMMKKYNIDPNRIYIHGLSNGGRGVLTALYAADWLFAAAAPMSAINSPIHHYYRQDPDVLHIPIWFFQGGKDTNPLPANTQATVNYLRARGGNVRYTLYPNLGHGTWNTAYAEPDFWTWLLSKNKSDIHVYGGGEARICATAGATPGARMYLSDEFYYYQWEKDGVVVSQGENAFSYTATVPGTYRARFSRKTSNPIQESDWNQWSKPVVVGVSAPPEPVVTNTKSVMLPDLNGSTSTDLIAPPNYFGYRWNFTTIDQGNIALYTQSPILAQTLPVTQPALSRTKWNYFSRVIDVDGCYTESRTNPRVVWFQNGLGATHNGAITVRPRVTNFQGSQTGVNDVLLQWADVTWERNYEIWRSRSTTAASNNWTLVTITPANTAFYVDKNLPVGVTFYYKIRAISDDSRTDYSPSDVKDSNLPADNVVVTITSSDTQGPSVPQNVQAVLYDTDVDNSKMIARVTWNPSTDNIGVVKYRINYNGSFIETADASTTIDVPELNINTNYAFTVQGVDAANNLSSASAQVNLFTKMDGVYYIHNTFFYTDMTQIQEPQWNDREFFNHLPNIDINETTQDSYFLMKFYGYLYISTPGQYQFRLKHNDGVRLKVNNQILITYSNYVQEGCLDSPEATITLPTGYVPIELRYWQSEDDRCLSWEYKGADTGTEAVPAGEWINIPNNRLTTIFDPVQPILPSIPEDFTVNPTGMDNLTLNWTTPDDPAPSFEVYRSLSSSGPWTMIEAVSTTSYVNNGLVPSTEYFYRVRSINSDGASGYTEVQSATTLDDEIPPSAPTNLTLTSTSLTAAAIAWTGSTDNVEVTGYRIYVKPQGEAVFLHSTVATTYASIEDLMPQTNYQVYVAAIDAMGNESEFSNTVHVSTVGVETFYHRTGGLTTLANWGSNTNGLGTPPSSFAVNGYYFNVRLSQSSNLVLDVRPGNASKVIIPENVTMNFTGAGGILGNVEIEDNGVLVLPNNTALPTFGLLAETSTVRYTSTAVQQVRQASYGNLELSGSNSSKVFQPGVTIIRGNLTVGANVAITGAPNNGTTIILYGDLIGIGNFLFTSPTNAVNLVIRKPTTQTFAYSGLLNLHQLMVTEPININQQTSGTLNLGSQNGGGLSLIDGSSLTVPFESTLRISDAGTINSGGETGRIHAAGGTVEIASSSEMNSRLYFDETIYKYLADLNVNLTGTGNVQILSPVEILQGIKVSNGDLFANGNITLISTADQTASLRRIEGTGRVVGDVNVQRYVSAKYNTYRYISSPVVGLTVSDWQQFFPITGNFTGRSPGYSTAASLYVLGNLGQWIPYPTNANGGSGAPIQRGVGYAAYIRNADFFTMTSAGEPYQGSIPFSLYPPAIGFDGWNLLGNPYASSIQWNNSGAAWTRTGIANVAAVRNNFSTYTGQFEYYDATTDLSTGSITNAIAQGQAFYVQVIAANPSLTVHEAAKYDGQQELYRGKANDVSHLFIHLKKDGLVDKAIIAFTAVGKDEYQPQFDGSKIRNEGMFNLATLTHDNVPVAINHMSNSFCDKEFYLSVQDVDQGSYTLEFPDFTTLQGVGAIDLVDNFTGITTDLATNKSYDFVVTDDSASFGANRFAIRMNRPPLERNLVASGSENCFFNGNIVLSNTQRGVTYSIFNAAGTTIASGLTSTGNDLNVQVPISLLNEGVNEFVISAGFEGCSSETLSQKVTIEHYTSPPVTLNDLSTCLGSPASVKVSTISNSVVAYNWYDANGDQVKGFNSSTLETMPVTEATYFSVAPVLKNGCEGARQQFVVYPEIFDVPELVFEHDTLFSSVIAKEYEWSLNGNVIATTHHNFISGLTPGFYTVTCTNGGCAKTSNELEITGDESDLNAVLQHHLYPNPASSGNINLKVVTKNKEDIVVKVIDVLGKEHYLQSFSPEQLRNTVKISPANEFRAGVYYMILKQESRYKEIKFVIKD